MGLAAGLALPLFGNSLDSVKNAAATRRVVAFLNDARVRAVNARQPVEVTYNFETRAFAQKVGEKGEEKARWPLPDGMKVARIEREGEIHEEDEGVLTFFPLGDSTGGTIFMEGIGGVRYKVAVGVLFASPVLTKLTEGSGE